MSPYIGTSTSRIDGPAKVTGAAKYAGEFKAEGLVYGFVVESTIAKGRIRSIDTRTALGITGVLDILSHQNRPEMADSDESWKDDVAPDEGSPFRPLYDDAVKFSGQPIALVLAEDSETARFAASLVRVEYEEESFATDLHAERDKAFAVEKPAKLRGDASTALARSAVRHVAEYVIPTEHHNPMEPFASTVIWESDGRLTVCDKTQGVRNVQRYLCGTISCGSSHLMSVAPLVRVCGRSTRWCSPSAARWH
jgi:xanthine dehydrogenase YagR molybdenum-binding subunit